MCTTECPCEPNAAVMYNNIDWSLWPSVASRGAIYTVPIGGVTSYSNCIKNAAEPVDSNDAFKTFAKSFRTQTDFDGLADWMTWFEDTYDCAGICKSAAFYWTKNPANSRPS